MPYEIHMIKAGNADAIALRHIFRVPGIGDTQFVAIIDGGYEEHGHELVDIVKNYYATNFVDLVVCTHHDNDHITGLKVVVEKLRISRVWVHDPANHGYFYNQIRQTLQRTTAKSYAQAVLRTLETLSDFLTLVDKNRIPRTEAFSGVNCGPLIILGRSETFYEQILSLMATEKELTKVSSLRDNDYFRDLLIQTMGEPELDENNETTPLNNTSAIILGSFDSDRCLFTGDAGVQALDDARFRWNFSELSWLDVPDHGSRRNLSSDLVEYLSPNLSYISAAGDDKHPHKSVVKALKKKGTVYSTHNNAGLWHHRGNIPDRSGWSPLTPL